MAKGGIPKWVRQVVEVVVGWMKPKKVKYFIVHLEDGTMQKLLKIGQWAVVSLDGVDAQGNLVTNWEGVPTWVSSMAGIGVLEPAADGRSAKFTAASMGTTQVSASMGAIRSKEPVDFIVEAGPLSAFVLSVGPTQG